MDDLERGEPLGHRGARTIDHALISKVPTPYTRGPAPPASRPRWPPSRTCPRRRGLGSTAELSREVLEVGGHHVPFLLRSEVRCLLRAVLGGSADEGGTKPDPARRAKVAVVGGD